jgi:carbon-monoxide dehydrogenase large subunit
LPTAAYRGFGQTQSAFVRERTVDLVAAELGLDPVELRRRNLIASDALPYTTRTFLTYDSGDYARVLERARTLLDEQLATAGPPPDDGRRRGVGVATYVQLAGVGPSTVNEMIGVLIGGYEAAQCRMEPDGTVRVHVGTNPHGQGHETTFAQVVADRLGIDPSAVQLIHGDTDSTPYSAYGTAASRSLAVGGAAAILAAEKVATKVRAIAAELLEANPDDVVLAGGRATVVGTDIGVPIAEVAARAWRGNRLPEGQAPGLLETHSYDPTSPTFSYATHACAVAVDPELGSVEIEHYVVVSDCGVIVNPTVVEGQIHGGVAQGLGAALYEEVVFDDQGQPRTASFMDYLVPDATNVPNIVVEHVETPSPYTPGGHKGMGEGGTNGAFPCVANAVAAALPEIADRLTRTPLSPERIWSAWQARD